MPLAFKDIDSSHIVLFRIHSPGMTPSMEALSSWAALGLGQEAGALDATCGMASLGSLVSSIIVDLCQPEGHIYKDRHLPSEKH